MVMVIGLDVHPLAGTVKVKLNVPVVLLIVE